MLAQFETLKKIQVDISNQFPMDLIPFCFRSFSIGHRHNSFRLLQLQDMLAQFDALKHLKEDVSDPLPIEKGKRNAALQAAQTAADSVRPSKPSGKLSDREEEGFQTANSQSDGGDEEDAEEVS